MMKFVVWVFILFNVLAFYLLNRSSTMLEQVESSISSSHKTYSSIQETTRTQRALSLAAVGFAIDENRFVNESQKLLISSESEFKAHLLFLENKKSSGKDISKKELVKLTALAEADYQNLMKTKDTSWGKANDSFVELVSSYKSSTSALFYMQIFSLLSLICIVVMMISRDKVKKQIKEKDRLHSQLFSSLLEGVFLCNSDGTVIACNSSGALIAGKVTKSLIGKNISQLFTNMDIRTENQEKLIPKNYFGNIIKKESIVFGQTIAVTGKNGYTNWYNLNAQPFSAFSQDSSSTMLLSFSNTTEKVHAQNTIKLQQIEIMEGSKLRTIGEMAGGIAHEIDNPLATIYATNERLGRKAERDVSIQSEVILKSTEKTLRTVERITSVVKSLLSLSRESEVDIQFVQIRDVLDLAMDLAQIELTRSQIEFKLDSKQLDTVIQCYPTQIAQVLLNLTKNSIDALENQDEKWLKLKITDEGEFVKFSLTDSGTSMTKEIADKVLLPFFTTKRLGKGTGLGLSISRTIIASHGGEIYVDMNSPTTSFVFTIPKKYPVNKSEDSELKAVS